MFYISCGKGFQVTFANGWTVSVQFGGGNYCENRNDAISDEAWKESGEKGSATAEVAAWDKDHKWHQFEGDQVVGYVPADGVLEIMNMIAAKSS